MDKKKLEVIVLVVLVIIGINYAIYSYYIQPQNSEIKTAEQNYNNLKAEVRGLKLKKQDLEEMKTRVDEKLKNPGDTVLLPEQSDNQSMIRELYAACKQYGVVGDTLTFSPQGAMAAAEGSQTGEAAAESDSAELFSNVKTQLITFTFSGEKGKVEKFIENIRTVSNRKLIITSIDITSAVETGVSINNTLDTAAQPVTAQLVLMEFLYSSQNAAVGGS
jgi:type IV pilus assembly protein PilO